MAEITRSDLIKNFEMWINAKLPHEYVHFLLTHEENVLGDRVYLYTAEDIMERNETYETKKYCPGFITIGSDSGDMQFALSLKDESVVMVDGGDMTPQGYEQVTGDLPAWIAAGCPLPVEKTPIYSATGKVLVYLEKKPRSLQTLLLIKRELAIDTSISALKSMIQIVPCPLSDQLSYMQAIRRCAKVNAIENCLGIRMGNDESIILPLEWKG